MDGDLTLKVNGTSLVGWKRIRVTRGVERMPSDFDIELTELYPDDPTALTVQPGDKCQVLLGADLVITGFVNRFAPRIDKGAHSIRCYGRSLSQDVVDCSAEWPNSQIVGASALVVAQNLVKPYAASGIKVSAAVDPGPPIPQFNITVGDTAFAVIERVCRFAGLLAYDQPDGTILLNQVGKTKAASGFKQGVNVEAAEFDWNDAEQYSEYDVFGLSMALLNDSGVGFNLIAKALDPNMKRHRLKFSVCEAGAAGQDVSQKRAYWEAARRIGRSRKVHVRCDSWRDSALKLWEPNTLVTLDLPKWKINGQTYCISEVSFVRDDQGTHADLVLMLPDAFLPQPIILQPTYRDIAGGTAAAPASSNPLGLR